MKTISKNVIMAYLEDHPGQDTDTILQVLGIPKDLLLELLVERMEAHGRITISFVVHDDGFYEPLYKIAGEEG
jgi:hypothetical protein